MQDLWQNSDWNKEFQQEFSRKCSTWKDFKLVKSSNLYCLVLSPKDRVSCGGEVCGMGRVGGQFLSQHIKPEPPYKA